MSVDVDPTTTGRRDRLRWGVLGLLLGLVVASLGVSAYLVLDRGAGSSPFDRIESLRDPGVSPQQDRERALSAARTFVQRFNTYGPEMLGPDNKMADYAAVGDLMTAKFAELFKQNVVIAEQAVAQTKVARSAEVYSVGIASIDPDSADLLVGGVVQFTYPNPEKPEDRVPFEPLRFRYDVSLKKVGGVWKVDDLDDLDDSLPSFGEASQPQVPAPAPSGAPSGAVTPSAPSAPSGAATPSGGATP